VGVLGAGQMGAGIAQVAAQAGYAVQLADVTIEQASRGRDGIAKIRQKSGREGQAGGRGSRPALASIVPALGVERARGLRPRGRGGDREHRAEEAAL
jgi:3-hydroxybutyryl-CoA dehydrogenase